MNQDKDLEEEYLQKNKKEYVRRIDTYAETICGCFTTLRKRAAIVAASSRLVAAAALLGFFGRLPNRLGAALLRAASDSQRGR